MSEVLEFGFHLIELFGNMWDFFTTPIVQIEGIPDILTTPLSMFSLSFFSLLISAKLLAMVWPN